MNKFFVKKENGFIALLSAIIISFVLLLTAVTLNFSGLYGRFNILESEFKERSNNLALTCVEKARFRLTADKNFVGADTIPVDSEECGYLVTKSGDLATVIADGSSANAFTYYHVVFDTSKSELSMVYFEEIKNHP